MKGEALSIEPLGSLIFCCENKVVNNMKSKKETSGFYDGRSWFDGLGFSEHGLMNHLLLA